MLVAPRTKNPEQARSTHKLQRINGGAFPNALFRVVPALIAVAARTLQQQSPLPGQNQHQQQQQTLTSDNQETIPGEKDLQQPLPCDGDVQQLMPGDGPDGPAPVATAAGAPAVMKTFSLSATIVSRYRPTYYSKS